MGAIRKKVTLINDAFGAVMRDAATRGQSLLNAGISLLLRYLSALM